MSEADGTRCERCDDWSADCDCDLAYPPSTLRCVFCGEPFCEGYCYDDDEDALDYHDLGLS